MPPTKLVKDGEKSLKKGTDYTVSFKNNTKVGTAEVTVTGKGNYAGKGNNKAAQTIKFSIVPRSLESVTVTAQENYAIDTRKADQTPLPSVKYGKQSLKINTDYTVTYKDSKGGTTDRIRAKEDGSYDQQYRMIISGMGKYTGKVIKTFSLEDKNHILDNAKITFKNGENKKTYLDGSEITFATDNIVVKVGDNILQYGKDYTINYSNNINPGTAYFVISPTEESSYVGSVTGTFTISGVPISKAKVELSETNFVFDGNAHGPVVKVTYNGEELSPGADYTVSGTTGKAVGKYTVYIRGAGKYTGTVKV